MNPEEDPEARIRQLEQPLAGYAVELGAPTDRVDANAALPPPVYDQYPPTSPYSAPPFGVAFPQHKGPPVGLIFGLIAVVVVLVFGGVGVVVWTTMANDVTGSPAYEPGEPGVAVGPTAPSDAPPIALPTDSPPGVVVAPAGGQYSVSGVDKVETIECNGSNISVSGVKNNVTLDGHCQSVTVSGVENVVVVDSTDRIGASGFDNRVIYRSGTPQINATAGTGNVVAQG